MPYTTRKAGPNRVCVYKKDTGKKVGCTTPAKIKDYLAALHIHSRDEGKKEKK